MRDIQMSKPEYNVSIDKVGIKHLSIPLIVLDKKNKNQRTIGEVSAYVNLVSFRGTHMSRFIEVLSKHTKRVLTVKVLDDVVTELRSVLGSQIAHLEVSFPFMVEKRAPVSKKTSYLNYNCKIIRIANTNEVRHFVQVQVPVTLLCPCSKEISDFGAHNQRAYVRLRVQLNKFVWIEDLIQLIENEASCEIYALLKREDEKFVTEKAYNSPKFVEDVVRGIAVKLMDDKRIAWFRVECESQESIHNHSAFACIEKGCSKGL